MPGWSGPCQTRALSRGYLGGPEPPLSLPVPQHSPARGGQGRGREASDCLCGLVPLGTAGVTWTHALPNTYTRADTDSSTHTNQHPPTSIHQILTQHKHTHTHTHTRARARTYPHASRCLLQSKFHYLGLPSRGQRAGRDIITLLLL